MVKLILVRHGETNWNADRRFQGQADVALNDIGWRGALELGRRLAGEKTEAIYASDLRRAQNTAAAIAAASGLEVRLEPRLREMSFGDWEGLVYSQISQRYPQALEAWQIDPVNVAPPAGENLDQLGTRVRAVLEQVVHRHQDQTVMLVAHGGPLQVLLCLAFDLSLEKYWQFRVDLASLSELYIYPEGPILTLLNDTCHLGEGKEENEWEG